MRVMVIGASRDARKFGYKAVRAYQRQGHEVLPVNPNAAEVAGVRCFASVSDPPGPIDRALLYVPAEVGVGLLEPLASRGDVGEVYANPGSESPALVARAGELGLEVVQACGILAIGETDL